jgi:hypothetical protein
LLISLGRFEKRRRAMAEKIKILAAAGAGALGIAVLYVLDIATSTAVKMNHLLPVVEGFARLATIRMFEIAYRLYSLPV